jgi:hypothetical protein
MALRDANRSLYLAKIEATEGTFSTPAAATDAILLAERFDPAHSFAFENEVGATVRGVIDEDAPLRSVGKVVQWTKRAHWRGLTTPPTALNRPVLDAWFRSAGYAVTFDATVGQEKATYTPAQSAFESMSEQYETDGRRRKVKGARSELGMSFDAGGPVVIECVSSGVLEALEDAALSAGAAFRGGVAPVAEGVTFSLNGNAATTLRRFEAKTGNTIARRDGANVAGGVAGWKLNGRKGTFTVVIEEPTAAVLDVEALAGTTTDVPVSLLVGSDSYGRLGLDFVARIKSAVPSTGAEGIPLLTVTGVVPAGLTWTLK